MIAWLGDNALDSQTTSYHYQGLRASAKCFSALNVGRENSRTSGHDYLSVHQFESLAHTYMVIKQNSRLVVRKVQGLSCLIDWKLKTALGDRNDTPSAVSIPYYRQRIDNNCMNISRHDFYVKLEKTNFILFRGKK